MSFCSLIKGITPNIADCVFVLINSVLLSLLCVSVFSEHVLFTPYNHAPVRTVTSCKAANMHRARTVFSTHSVLSIFLVFGRSLAPCFIDLLIFIVKCIECFM